MFPIFSPVLASTLKLTQPQLTTIVLAGMIGQYPFSPIVGKVLDLYGSSTCSLIAAVCFSTAFVGSALEIAGASAGINYSSTSSFHRLTFFFLVIGLGTVFSYFSSVFAASKHFPNYPGLASGATMALFGLSPLCLSVLASEFFTDSASGILNIVLFLKFMAVLTASTHVLGYFVLLSHPAPYVAGPIADCLDCHENSTLLPRKTGDQRDEPLGNPVAELPPPIQEWSFWFLWLYCFLVIGAAEMVITNIGTIVLSLPPSRVVYPSDALSDHATSREVRILSISNTLSRIVVGPLADLVSPVALYLPTGTVRYPRKHRVSRVVFLAVPALLLAFIFVWMELGAMSREAVRILSFGTGISYGAVFTVLPSIVSAIWGVPNLGRNFGIITYAPFIGTPLFSYLYALVSASNSKKDICEGIVCWRMTFWISAGTSMLSFFGSIVLWMKWKGRL